MAREAVSEKDDIIRKVIENDYDNDKIKKELEGR